MTKAKKSFGETLIQAAHQAATIARGEMKPGRLTRRTLSNGSARVHEPPRYDAKRIRRLRERLNMSQPVFARSLNASDATVKAWEQGKRVPDGTSLRLLELAEKAPKAFVDVVGIGDQVGRNSVSARRRNQRKR